MTNQRRSAYDRLEAFLARQPDALDTLSLREMGQRARLSRETVRKLLPEFGQRTDRLVRRRTQHTQKKRRERLAAFVKAHPRALKTPARGGMALKEIARRLKVDPAVVGTDWRALGLPSRTSQRLTAQERNQRHYENSKAAHYELTKAWKRRNRDRAIEIHRAANRRYRNKVLRRERCVVCRTRFPWTVSREASRRTLGSRITCSRSCAMTGLGQSRRGRSDDRRDSAARPARRDRQSQARPGKPTNDRRRRA